MDEIQNWLASWFKEKKGATDCEDLYTCNYFQAGYIDSFGVVELIMDIESNFKIRFSQDHFQDRRFSSIKGLADIIRELQNS